MQQLIPARTLLKGIIEGSRDLRVTLLLRMWLNGFVVEATNVDTLTQRLHCCGKFSICCSCCDRGTSAASPMRSQYTFVMLARVHASMLNRLSSLFDLKPKIYNS